MKLFHIDLETTGVDAVKNGVIQLSGIVEIDGEDVETLDLLMRPFPEDIIEQSALDVTRRTKEEIMGFEDPLVVYKSLTRMMDKYVDKYDKTDKFHFVGFNSRFDDDFMRAWFKKCGDSYYGSYFHWPSIDVANVAALKFMEFRHGIRNFKLMTVAEYAGVKVDESKAHDALYDIQVTRELFRLLTSRGALVEE